MRVISIGLLGLSLTAAGCNTGDALLGAGPGEAGATGQPVGFDASAGRDAGGSIQDSGSIQEAGLPPQEAGNSPTSCQSSGAGLTNCGPNIESCCTSPVVDGGTFYRSFDGVTFTDMGNPATVTDFRLDKYEVTVGRFRQFVAAVVGGWRPATGSGKHTHLNGGQGLADSSATPGTYESGWNPLWDNNLSSTLSGWNSLLTEQPTGDFSGAAGACNNWTPSAGANENLPIDCINWYQAYAFCIWDNGFLPSEAEWNYAASGGSQQRVYPWSTPPTSQTIDCSYAKYGSEGIQTCTGDGSMYGTNDVGSESPKGDGLWGQSDLAGNVYEWTLDYYALYAVPCVDCAYLSGDSEPVTDRVERGGSYMGASVLDSDRNSNPPTMTAGAFGARCARVP